MTEDTADPWTPQPEQSKLNALGLLQSIYSNPSEPLARRMRAAIASLPFESPKLAVTTHLNGEGFASEIERALRRSGKVIEAQAIRAELSGPSEAEPAALSAKYP